MGGGGVKLKIRVKDYLRMIRPYLSNLIIIIKLKEYGKFIQVVK